MGYNRDITGIIYIIYIYIRHIIHIRWRWKIEEMMGWLMLTISWGYEGDTCSLDISCNKTAKACQDQ